MATAEAEEPLGEDAAAASRVAALEAPDLQLPPGSVTAGRSVVDIACG